MKSFTDLVQSKKLAEILPLESADGYWDFQIDGYNLIADKLGYYKNDSEIPCWSLAALLEVIRNNGRYELQMYEGGYYFEANGFMTESYFNPIDACYEMILKLNEQKLL